MRFGSSEVWTQTTIGKIAQVVGGGTPETDNLDYWNGNIQWFTPSEVGQTKSIEKSERTISVDGLNKSSAKLLPVGTLLLSTRATVGECSIALNECSTNQGFQSLIASDKVNNEFLYYLIATKKRHFVKYACGSTFLEISNKEVAKTKIFVPQQRVQEKIATFLSKIDQRIETQSKIIEDLELVKKGISNTVFGDKSVIKKSWETVKLSTILKERKTYDIKDSVYPHATLSKEGISAKTDRYNRDFLVKDEEKEYKITHLNDICYNPANLKFGVICLNTFGDAIFSPIYITYEIDNQCDPYFISLYLTNPTFIGHIRKYEQGTVYERMAVSSEDFLKGEINLPTYEEQLKIAKTFKSIDEKIAIEQVILDKLKEQKKFLLSNMFI